MLFDTSFIFGKIWRQDLPDLILLEFVIFKKKNYSFKQGTLSILEYYMHIKLLWDEFANLRSIPKHKCEPQCSCELVPIIKSYHNGDCVIRFLKGLNESFSAVNPISC